MNHTHHTRAREWFDRNHHQGWATTPFTEAGFVRVSSNRAAIAAASTPQLALRILTEPTGLAGHHFWTDDVALSTGDARGPDLITSHRDVTDAHLLALAERHGGRLVAFDVRVRAAESSQLL